MLNNKRVLIVAAHPDDEVLGCGATAKRLSDEGADVKILILGEGATSRADKRDTEAMKDALTQLRASAKKKQQVL